MIIIDDIRLKKMYNRNIGDAMESTACFMLERSQETRRM